MSDCLYLLLNALSKDSFSSGVCQMTFNQFWTIVGNHQDHEFVISKYPSSDMCGRKQDKISLCTNFYVWKAVVCISLICSFLVMCFLRKICIGWPTTKNTVLKIIKWDEHLKHKMSVCYSVCIYYIHFMITHRTDPI